MKLTNSVPQHKSFNGRRWSPMEGHVKCVMDKYCKNNSGIPEAFVLTGAQPGVNKTKQGGVNIPKTLWTAFCCYSKELRKWVAGAHWGDNKENGDELTPQTVEKLNGKFGFKLFPKQCLKFSPDELTKMFRDTKCSEITHDCDENADKQLDKQPDKQPDKQRDKRPRQPSDNKSWSSSKEKKV